MMARSETGGAASGVVDDVPIVVAPQWRLQRQRSVPAAVVAAFAQCGGGGGGHQQHARRSLRLGGKPAGYYQHDVSGDEQEREYFDPGGGSCYYASSAARPAGGGGGGGVGLLRALWRRIVRGKMRRKVMSRSRSSSVREQYGQDEYEQNFDEGAAAAEPEYLSRSFSARRSTQFVLSARTWQLGGNAIIQLSSSQMAGMGGSMAEETAAAAQAGRRKGIDRQAVDRGLAYVLMVVALVATYALH
ncbi:hypothetical protein ABZP36_022691 [Zizania latifolia]